MWMNSGDFKKDMGLSESHASSPPWKDEEVLRAVPALIMSSGGGATERWHLCGIDQNLHLPVPSDAHASADAASGWAT